MRPRHPAVLLGALIAKHVLEVQPVDHDAIVSLIKADQEDTQALPSQAQAAHGSDGLGTLGSPADGSRARRTHRKATSLMKPHIAKHNGRWAIWVERGQGKPNVVPDNTFKSAAKGALWLRASQQQSPLWCEVSRQYQQRTQFWPFK